MLHIFPRPKKFDIKFTFETSGTFCFIKHEYGEPPVSEITILTTSAIKFMQRYFKVADNKQKKVMRQMLEYFLQNEPFSYTDVMSEAEKIIYDSLNNAQRKALAGHAQSYGDMPAFLSKESLKNATPRAEFYLVNSRGKWSERLYLKLGYDKIMLSRFLVLMLEYVDGQLKKSDREYYHTLLLTYLTA